VVDRLVMEMLSVVEAVDSMVVVVAAVEEAVGVSEW